MKKPVSHDKAVSRLAHTIKGYFAAGMMPNGKFSAEEITSLEQRWMEDGIIPCVYCGGVFHCWDHLYAIRSKGTWGGYPNTIDNLVPACSRCNDSKSGANWKAWFLGRAKDNPLNRQRRGELFKIDLDTVVPKIEAYEANFRLKKIDFDIERKKNSILDNLLQQYDNLRDEMISKVEPAQKISDDIRSILNTLASDKSNDL